MAKEVDEVEPSERSVAVITGASSGVGHATALEFARHGYNVVLAARRGTELKAVAGKCEELGARALVVTADTTDEGQVKKIADAARGAYGHFDVWVNDAAVGLFSIFEDAPTEDFRRVIETNFFGYVNGAREAIKQFKAQGYGTLINISSMNASTPMPYTTAYNASKYAIRGLTESIRMELELEDYADTVNICNVMPASIDTNFYQNAANYTGREVQALEPVYNPAYVASHIVKLVKSPKREVILGPAAKMMHAEFMFFPRLYEKLAARFTDRNVLGNRTSEDTPGNLYNSLPANTGMTGGWQEKRLPGTKFNAAVGAMTAVIVGAAGLGYYFYKKSD